jgi:hypothetical protein
MKSNIFYFSTLSDDHKEDLPLSLSSNTFELKSSQSVLKANTRQVGQLIEVELIKSKNGLGFTISSRDTITTGFSPLIINRLLPGGTALCHDIKIGDR